VSAKGVNPRRFEYVEKVLKNGLPDGRKRFILYCGARYLINVKGLNEDEALNEIADFIARSEELPEFRGDGKVYES